MSTAITWPVKSRELHSHHFDSTIWNDFQFRPDDIIIATYAKSGTTWMQQIVAQMMFNGHPDLAFPPLRLPPHAPRRVPRMGSRLSSRWCPRPPPRPRRVRLGARLPRHPLDRVEPRRPRRARGSGGLARLASPPVPAQGAIHRPWGRKAPEAGTRV